MSLTRFALIAALGAAPFASAALAQRVADMTPIDVVKVAGEAENGWVKKQSGSEGVTFVCETDSCGGRGVLGVGQAQATPAYIRAAVSDPDKTLKAFKYATDESMRPSGCSLADFTVRRLGERRVQYEGKGACKEGNTAAMATIFDLDRPNMMSVQVLTKDEATAVRLRDAYIGKVAAALDAPAQ